MAVYDFRTYVTVKGKYEMLYSEDLENEKFFKGKIHPGSIMQFTGVKDIKEKKIYESDILKIKGTLYIVYWDEWNARFALKNTKNNRTEKEFRELLKEAEVIGNVSENAEILIK